MKPALPFVACAAALALATTTASALPRTSENAPPNRFTTLAQLDAEYLRDARFVSLAEAKTRQRFMARAADLTMQVAPTLRAEVYGVSVDDVHNRLIVMVASHTPQDAHPLLDNVTMAVARWGIPLVFVHSQRVPLNPSLPTDKEPLPEVPRAAQQTTRPPLPTYPPYPTRPPLPTRPPMTTRPPVTTAPPSATPTPDPVPSDPGNGPQPEPLPTVAPSVKPFPSTMDHSGQEKIAPFFGGGRTADCTTAFTAVNPTSGEKFMVTAGHCITKGSKGQVRSFAKTVMGYKGDSTYPMDGTARGDYSLISNNGGKDFAPSVYYGLGKTIPDSMTLRVIGSDKYGVQRSATYCINAMRSGASCGWKLVSGPTQIKYDNGGGHSTLVTGLTRVDGSNAPGIGKGDSGATMYRVEGRGAVIGGLLSGVLDDSCTYNQGDDLARCSKLFISGAEQFAEAFPQLEVASD